MLAEHLVYTTAIAIIAGMLFFRYTGRDTTWIIILVSYVPDLDKIADRILTQAGFTVLFEGHTIHHGTFHNIAAMVIIAVIIAFLLHPFGIRFLDSFLFTIIGFGAHLFEDALVYPSHAMYLWPLYKEKMGLGWLPVNGFEESYNADFFHIANMEVLFIGLLLLIIAILIRSRFEGHGWVRHYLPECVYLFLAKNNPL
jgi:hypothetical protein